MRYAMPLSFALLRWFDLLCFLLLLLAFFSDKSIAWRGAEYAEIQYVVYKRLDVYGFMHVHTRISARIGEHKYTTTVIRRCGTDSPKNGERERD